MSTFVLDSKDARGTLPRWCPSGQGAGSGPGTFSEPVLADGKFSICPLSAGWSGLVCLSPEERQATP